MPLGKLLMIPGPTNVDSEVYHAMVRPLVSHRGAEFRRLYEGLVEKLRRLLATDGTVIPLTASGTGAIEAAIASLFSRGEKLCVVRNGVFGERAGEIARRRGLTVRYLDVEWGRAPAEEEVKAFLDENGDAAGLYVVYNETSTGVAARPLERLVRLAKDRGVLTVVDAVSAVGGDYLYMDRWGIDVCIGASQKCIAAPPVVSFVGLGEEALERLRRVEAETLYLDLREYVRWYEERRETPATPAIPLFQALDAALDRVLGEGVENRVRRHQRMAAAFYGAFEAGGIEPFAQRPYRSNTVISLRVPEGASAEEVIRDLERDYGVVIAGGMGRLRGRIFRIGSMGEVSREAVLRTVAGLCNALMARGVKVNVSGAVEAALAALGGG